MDIVQESFFKLWKNRHDVDWTAPKPYLFRIALNTAANKRRWHKLRNFCSLCESQPATTISAEQILDDRRRRRHLQCALEQLPKAYRETLLLCTFSEMKQSEVANVLNVSPGTIASRCNRDLDGARKHSDTLI